MIHFSTILPLVDNATKEQVEEAAKIANARVHHGQ